MWLAGRSLDDLGTPGFSWVDLRAFVRHAPRTSAYFRAVHGELADWDLQAQLTAQVIDLLQSGNWQRAGKKNAPKPKPFPRPWLKKGIGTTTSMPLDEMDAFLGYSPQSR
jgi:hypothetical protein